MSRLFIALAALVLLTRCGVGTGSMTETPDTFIEGRDPRNYSTPEPFWHCHDNEVGLRTQTLQCVQLTDKAYWLPRVTE